MELLTQANYLGGCNSPPFFLLFLKNMTNFSSLYVGGVPVTGDAGIPATSGKRIYVDYTYGSDGNTGTMEEPVKTIAQAYSMTTTNKDDQIILMGSATHPLTAMLTVAKNRVHFYGLDGCAGGRVYGQNAKVLLGVTTSALDLGAVLVTGARCSFHNIKFISNNTKDESIYTFLDGGEYTVMRNCEIYKSTDMDVTGAAELVANGDSSQYINCTIGSLATARSGAVIRPCVLFTAGVAGAGKVARDNLFTGCRFWINASNTANRFVYGANATDIERVCEFEYCKFINNGLSSALPAQNIAFGATLTVGDVLVHGCTSLNASTAMSTTTGVFVDSAVPAAATSGISVQAS